jgi:pilus assembly protein CpaE
LRAVGQAPDVTIPYSRDIAIASNLGVKATQKCAALDRGMDMLLRELAGEAATAPRSLLRRIFG